MGLFALFPLSLLALVLAVRLVALLLLVVRPAKVVLSRVDGPAAVAAWYELAGKVGLA
jgi:hypothetical protein